MFHLFYQLCFSLNAEYEHDPTLADAAVEAVGDTENKLSKNLSCFQMFSCLAVLSDPMNIAEFHKFLLKLQRNSNDKDSENVKRVADSILHGYIIILLICLDRLKLVRISPANQRVHIDKSFRNLRNCVHSRISVHASSLIRKQF